MTRDARLPLTPRMKAAVNEMKERISHRYAAATFSVYEWDDPEGIYLVATLDVDDLEEATDLILDRMVDLQVGEGLPLFVIPERTLERNLAIMAEQEQARATATVP